jgi:predicted enzyme related to lactoylglutathione lyase
MKSLLNWFEIPATDLNRAAAFYETVLGVQLRREEFFGEPHAIFPRADSAGGVGGALVLREKLRPGEGGAIVYFDTTGRLDDCLARVAKAGGKVVQGRTSIGEMGAIGLIRDPEGNTVGLHTA